MILRADRTFMHILLTYFVRQTLSTFDLFKSAASTQQSLDLLTDKEIVQVSVAGVFHLNTELTRKRACLNQSPVLNKRRICSPLIDIFVPKNL